MRNLLVTIFTLISVVSFAQQRGTISGRVQDKDMDLEPLPFVSIYDNNNNTIGTTSDFDGNYSIMLSEGVHTLVFDYVGYETVKKQVTVQADMVQKMTVTMTSVADALEAVVLTVVVNKESEEALLAVQKEKVEIVESIGAIQLSKSGVSDAAAATAKITGVTKNEASGDVFVRGLGDRYLFTTMNGLPIPSDNVEKKNIDLNLFPTSIIQNVGISKTYSTVSYADQTSGHVNITSKEYSKGDDVIKVGLGFGINSNTVGKFGDFKATQNINNTTFGFHSTDLTPKQALIGQSWNTENQSVPLDYSFSVVGGNKYDISEDDNLSFIASLSHSRSYDYAEGTFASYRSNSRNTEFNFTEEFSASINTTALLDLKYSIGRNHDIKFTNLYINKLSDNVYEQGRDGLGYVLDQQPAFYGAFVRDQNTKQTSILVNQLLGDHHFDEKNKFNWALGYNNVKAEEPNRIRNEVNFGTEENNVLHNDVVEDGIVEYAFVGDYQQRKSRQSIQDFEYNALANYQYTLFDEEDRVIHFNIGGNYRNRTRDFYSKFDGLGIVGVDLQVANIDNLSEGFTQENLDNNIIEYKDQPQDSYEGQLSILAGYVNTDMKFKTLTIGLGLRYEEDIIDLINWNVNNYPGRTGSNKNNYKNLLPSFTVKKELSDKHTLRLAASKTVTLPEFKELAPFNYVSPTGRVTGGNPDLIASTNYNVDVKWEFFPSKKELLSVTGFYKMIQDPINRRQVRGSSGYFSFANTGEKANVYGTEIENKSNLYESENFGKLDLKANATFMLHHQDLEEEFQFNNKTNSGLAGASDYIINGGLSYSDQKEEELNVNISANYSSDKIFSLGSPESLTSSDVLFNDEIIEKGFVTLDLIVSKQLSENFKIKGSFKNLLNPSIDQTQDIKTNRGTFTRTVSSYQRGLDLGVSLSYAF